MKGTYMIKKIIFLSIISISFAAMHGMEEEKYPLHKAVEKGDFNTAKLLIEQGIDVNIYDENKRTALHTASFSNTFDCTKTQKTFIELLLEKGVKIDAYDKNNETAIDAVTITGNVEILKLLLEKGANTKNKRPASNGVSLLHKAIGYHGYTYRWPPKPLIGYYEDIYRWPSKPLNCKYIINLLVEHGADINKDDDRHGKTMLHYLAHWNPYKWGHEYKDRQKEDNDNLHEILQCVILHGANINAQDKKGDTPLHEAIRLNNKAMEEYLIQRGANMEIENMEGKVPEDQCSNCSFKLHDLPLYRKYWLCTP